MQKRKSGCCSSIGGVIAAIVGLITIYQFWVSLQPPPTGCPKNAACVNSGSPTSMYKNWDMTLDCQLTTHTYDGTSANLGNIFIILNTTIQNDSNDTQMLDGSLFEVVGNNGYPYYEDAINHPDRPLSFNSYEKQSIRMVFQVKDDDNRLIYKFLGNPERKWSLPYKRCAA